MSGFVGRVERLLRRLGLLLRKLLRVSLWPVRSPGQTSHLEQQMHELAAATRVTAASVDQMAGFEPPVDELAYETTRQFPAGLEVWTSRMDGVFVSLGSDLQTVERCSSLLAEQQQELIRARAEIDGWGDLLPEDPHG